MPAEVLNGGAPSRYALSKKAEHCPYCQAFVKLENLPGHLRNVHGRGEEAARIEKRAPRPRASARGPRIPLWGIMVAVLAVLAVAGGAYRASQPPPEPTPETPLTEMCVQHTGAGVHFHATIMIDILGQSYQVPADVGIVSGTCMRPVHTHETDGIAHVEMPSARAAYLRDFFAIWGQPFSSTQILDRVADDTHEIVFHVNGTPSTAYGNLRFADGQSIHIGYESR